MPIDDDASIERIRGKIAACAEIYRQENDAIEQKNQTAKRKSEIIDHRWPVEMTPVLSEQEIQAFEKNYKIQLPADYRLFLKEVGNGGVGGPANTGLFPLEIGEDDRLDKPFPLTDSWNEADDDVIEEIDDGASEDANDEARVESAPNYYTDGSIYLCSFGCGQHARLIVNGPEYGNVWFISPEAANYAEGPETTEDSEPTRIGFIQWYEYWLNERLEPDAEQPAIGE